MKLIKCQLPKQILRFPLRILGVPPQLEPQTWAKPR
ncbi:hypothetical protein IIV6-T1_002 [Invertebrate iridescent virus 6]|nr:hypothetical protein IIV6-T1_002 [Invertebrate iridescent virus 6]